MYSGLAISLVGYEIVKHTTKRALAEAGYDDIRVVKVAEVYDYFSTNKMLVIDAIGFSTPSRAYKYVRSGGITYSTKHVVFNPSGGLISKGHLLGATGIAQASELVWQLRGYANNRYMSIRASKIAL